MLIESLLLTVHFVFYFYFSKQKVYKNEFTIINLNFISHIFGVQLTIV